MQFKSRFALMGFPQVGGVLLGLMATLADTQGQAQPLKIGLEYNSIRPRNDKKNDRISVYATAAAGRHIAFEDPTKLRRPGTTSRPAMGVFPGTRKILIPYSTITHHINLG